VQRERHRDKVTSKKRNEQPRPIEPKIKNHCGPAGEARLTSIHIKELITLKDPEGAAQGLMKNSLTPVISDC